MKNKKVDELLAKEGRWQAEMLALRALILECGMEETVKWGHPCYVYEGGNVVLIHGFKQYVALLFFKGALMKDEWGILTQQSENVQAARQMRFKNLAEIEALKSKISPYVYEAMEIEKAGLKVEMKKTAEFEICEEFEAKMKAFEGLKLAFESLTPGRQRAYLLYFSEAKQAKTRMERIDKMTPKILSGKGLKDM